MNVLTDMYQSNMEETITKLIKKKEAQKDMHTQSCKLTEERDWRGNRVTKKIDRWTATKFRANASFVVKE